MTPIIFGKARAKAWLQRALLVVIAASLSGCFDDGSGNADTGTVDQPAANQPPEVSGTPASAVAAGEAYSFQPAASDADGDFLEYSITNQPTWATFNDETGLLTGTPGDANVGDTDDITITITDGKDTRSIGPFKIRVNGRGQEPSPTNRAPQLLGTPSNVARVGQDYGFIPIASDPDGDALRFLISNRPAWASFNSSTGSLTGRPTAANVAVYSNIVISVSDGALTTSMPPFSIEVPADNRAPTITGSPATTVQATQTYTFQPSASDPERDALVYRISNQPRWATFSTASGRLSGTPASTDVGTYSSVTISVSDGLASASLPAFSIVVSAPANRRPTITGAPATSVSAGSAYSFTPTANDPDSGDTLGFTIQNRPSWAAFDTATGRLSGTPGATVTGTFGNIVINVSDGRLSASLPAFAITVTPPSNHAPTISGTPATTATAGAAYNFLPTATDVDSGDTLTYSIQNMPSWATFNTATGRLSGTPATANAGTYSNIVISVSDGEASATLPSFAITVSQAANGSAVLSWTPPTLNTDGSALTNLAGYRVVYGRTSTALDQTVQLANPGLSTYTLTSLASGTWYFAVRAYTSVGGESDVSNVGTKTIP